MSIQPVLAGIYPDVAGWKATETSREAAEATNARGLRALVWAWLNEHGPHTADEAAAALGLSLLAVRPRFSELKARHRICDTGARRVNASGKRAIVWRTQ